MSISNRVKKALDDGGVHYEHLEHPPAYTAQEVAEAEHVPGKQIAKTVIVTDDGTFAMAVLPATRRVDLEALGRAAGMPGLRLADEGEFEGLFPGCETGAMAPFGNLYDIPVFVDQTLREDETITFSAGTHEDAIRMAYADWERVVQPAVAAFSEPLRPA